MMSEDSKKQRCPKTHKTTNNKKYYNNTDHREKIKENKAKDKYLDIAWELKKL